MANEENKFVASCVYYDKDLKRLEDLFEETNEIFKDISTRFARKDTLEISTSIFKYMEKSVLKCKEPRPFYQYVCDDIEIYIFSPRSGTYNIKLCGFSRKEITSIGFNGVCSLPGYDDVYCLSSGSRDLVSIISFFNDIVFQYLEWRYKRNGLF